MTIQDIIKIFDKFGWLGFIAIIILFILGFSMKTNWFSDLMSKLSDKLVEFFLRKKVKEIKNAEISESDIINHDIFNYIDFWIYSKVPIIQFSTEYRTIVFRKYLTVFLKSHKDSIKEYIQSSSYKSMDKSELWKSLLNLINKIVWDYEREFENAGIPSIIIHKMKAKNNDTIQLTIDLIESISNSQFYESDKNYLKIYSILNILLSILENTISNSQSVCDAINGQLKGKTITENGRTYTEP